MIGQLCTCDINNYGDLLYPVIFRKMAEKHGVTSDIAPMCFFQGPAPCDARYLVQDVNKTLLDQSNKLSHLVIGGGDILRADIQTVANHYSPIFEQREGIQPLFFRFKKLLMSKRRWAKSIQSKFIRKYFGYSTISPFILDRTLHTAFDSLIYCSCGVPFKFPLDKHEATRKAFDSASFIYVRDQQSMDKLKEIGVKRGIEVAPDLIVTLSDFFSKEEEKLKGLAILASYGVDTSKEIICFQTKPETEEVCTELLHHLTALRNKTGAEIVLLPIGYCHGDDVFLKNLAIKSCGVFTYLESRSIFATISILAASSLFIGTSMHGNITAFSFGIPHLFGPIAVDKVKGFLNIVGLGKEFQLDSWADIDERHTMLEKLPADYFTTRAEHSKNAVNDTFGKIADILKQ